MLRPQGYSTVVSPDAPVVERDTITCGHCQRVVFVKPNTAATTYLIPGTHPDHPWREEPGACCRVCMRSICLTCCDVGRCTPFERQIEQMEARQRFREQIGV